MSAAIEPVEVDQVRHFAHRCPGRLERFGLGLDAVCARCGERFRNAYGRLSSRVTAVPGITPSERAHLNALAQHLDREQPVLFDAIPAEYQLKRGTT